MKRSVRAFVAFVVLTGGGQLLSLRPAAAEAAGPASCLGIEASAVSPPGSSDEAPDGMTDIVTFVRGAADDAGVSPGAIFSSVARLHEGSHAACDEATE